MSKENIEGLKVCKTTECGGTHEDLYYVHAFDVDDVGEVDTGSDPDEFYLCMVCKEIMGVFEVDNKIRNHLKKK